jgi:hypothetical protein
MGQGTSVLPHFSITSLPDDQPAGTCVEPAGSLLSGGIRVDHAVPKEQSAAIVAIAVLAFIVLV